MVIWPYVVHHQRVKRSMAKKLLACFGVVYVSALIVYAQSSAPSTPSSRTPAASPGPAPTVAERALLDQYCVSCHNQRTKSGGLALDQVDLAKAGENAELWEKVIRKLRSGMMPPA